MSQPPVFETTEAEAGALSEPPTPEEIARLREKWQQRTSKLRGLLEARLEEPVDDGT